MKNWTPFWWESNQTWGKIESPEDWEKVVACYGKPGVATLDQLATAQEAPEGHGRNEAKIPKFGFRIECNGDLTLKDWADANQMILKSVNYI
jgi:hypothetical protein